MSLSFRSRISLLLFLLSCGLVSPAVAQSRYSLDLSGMPLSTAIRQVVEATQIEFVFDPSYVEGRTSNCIARQQTLQQILECVLAETGLEAVRTPSGAYTLHKKPPRPITVSGYVRDAKNGEFLAGSTVYVPALETGTFTNRLGHYRLSLPAGEHTLSFSFVGYENRQVKLELRADTTLTVLLDPSLTRLGEVEVTANRTPPIEERVQMSAVEVPVGQIQQIPAILGERDVLKALQILPGVQSGLEGFSGIFVRGGSADQNLMLLDGVPVYNASHLFGFFSIFTTEALHSVEFLKGGFPARYGGRLSSVVDISLRDGNPDDFKGSANIGLIASNVTLEGPIGSDRTTFLITGRRTYADLLLRPFMNETDGIFGYYFYDLIVRLSHSLSPRDRIYLTAYGGTDRLKARQKMIQGPKDNPTQVLNGKAGLGWGNNIGSLRWTHLFGSRLFANTTLALNHYVLDSEGRTAMSFWDTAQNTEERTSHYRYESTITDWSLRTDLNVTLGSRQTVRLGGGVIHHTYRPAVAQYHTTGSILSDTTFFVSTPTRSLDWSLYAENDVRLSGRLRGNLGLHFSAFAVDGRTYQSVQPRLSALYLLPGGVAAKASFVVMQQYVQLLVNSGFSLPTDLWVPTTGRTPPQSAWQVAAGLAKTVENAYEVSLEGYYKRMDGLVEYKPGAGFVEPMSDWQDQVELGEGWSYGVELLVQKKLGRTTGWLGYGLSRTTRHFPGTEINFGEPFPFKYDRRHDLSVTLTHRFSERLDVSGSWMFMTGSAISLPVATYWTSCWNGHPGNLFQWSDCYVDAYGERNGYRLGAHHRLDVSADYHFSRDRNRSLSLGLYNAYNRRNPVFMYAKTESGYSNWMRRPRQFALFPVIPFISYKFTF